MKAMRFALLTTATLTALAVCRAGENPGDALQGTWICDYVEKSEVPIPAELANVRFTFKEGKLFISQRGGAEKEHSFVVDATKTPRHFDIMAKGEKAIKGIYELKKNELTICVQHGDGERPTAFATKADDFGLVLLIFKKQMPKKEK